MYVHVSAVLWEARRGLQIPCSWSSGLLGTKQVLREQYVQITAQGLQPLSPFSLSTWLCLPPSLLPASYLHLLAILSVFWSSLWYIWSVFWRQANAVSVMVFCLLQGPLLPLFLGHRHSLMHLLPGIAQNTAPFYVFSEY